MRIAMTLQHEWKIDSRVIREAEALVRAGNQVLVVCRGQVGQQLTETQNGVVYKSLPRSAAVNPRRLVALFLVHLRIYSLWLADRFKIGWRCGLRETWGSLKLMVILALVSVPFAVIKIIAVLISQAIRSIVIIRVVFPMSLRRIFRNALQSFRRFSAEITLRFKIREAVASYVEPLVHLNDYAVSCTASIVSWQPDVVHIHDMVCLSGGYLAARKLDVPFIYDAHELETHTNYQLRRLTWLFIDRYQNALIRRAAAVITVCESIADWLSRKYGIARPTVILNTPALDTSGSGGTCTETLRSHLGLGDSEKLAVYVGAVTIDRGLENCVEALQYAPGIHMALVGSRYSVTEELLVRLADELGVSERLHLVDPVPGSLVVPFIRSATFSLIPIQNVCLSYYYCMPNKLLESVVGGLPVAIARLKELKSFLEKFPVGIEMDESSPKSIALAMQRLSREADKYRPTDDQISAIISCYGWDSQRAKLVRLYDGLTSSLSN
ncbi:MAG: glycosyltransferase family 4 protein [Candidatus Accumulibacter necessarius]|jgi:glycosyltransferase involved in cell wall biosynthesis|uniref:glycosyltransferase family 4 protein n=1 Tax=Candidatus Accumulibacter necessarius TaxID=2954386 RepID=UPI002FC2E911